jgi:hypothetical protein
MNEEQAQLDRAKAEALDAILAAQAEAKHWQNQFNALAKELAQRLGHQGGPLNLDALLEEVTLLKEKPQPKRAARKKAEAK